MDATKAIAKLSRKICILIPSILSTTAWINSTASLKKGNQVHHVPGKYNQVIIDSHLIAGAPINLNFGGLMDLLVGYSGLSDWRLKKQKKGKKISEFAEKVVLEYCNRIKAFIESPDELTPDRIPQMAQFIILKELPIAMDCYQDILWMAESTSSTMLLRKISIVP